jgi:hypothetical protein
MTANTADIRTAGHSISGHGQNLRNTPEPSGLGEGCLGNLAHGTVSTLNTHISKVGSATKWLHDLRQTDWRTQRGKRNDNLTLTPEMQSVLDHHAQRPDKPVTTTFAHSMTDDSGNNGPLRMNHDLAFHYQEGQDPSKYQYIRFSKATKVSGSDIASTEPGYVRYSPNTTLAGGKPVRHDGLNTQLDNGFQHAHWSLDGPREPFSDATHTGNHDNPGIVGMTKAPFVYPFGMKTEFYGVLYDPDAGKIMNVTHYQGTFTKPSLSSPVQHQSNEL